MGPTAEEEGSGQGPADGQSGVAAGPAAAEGAGSGQGPADGRGREAAGPVAEERRRSDGSAFVVEPAAGGPETSFEVTMIPDPPRG